MELLDEAMQRFHALLEEARGSGDPEPTAMTLATSAPDGQVSARTVLLKDADRRGFVFYTNYQSNKGRQLLAQPRCALLFLWKHLRLHVQVKIEGSAEPVSAEEADAYFASRPRDSQLGAWASMQSQTLDDRQTLHLRLAAYAQQYADTEVPRPPWWSGFRVPPRMIEFWFGQPFRLHERERYELGAEGWSKRLLYP